MTLPRSVLLSRPVIPATASSVLTIRAYGELDDPVRLLVILADHLGPVVSRRDEAAHCLNRRATWRSRIDALSDLLTATKCLHRPYAALVDPDALAPIARPDWHDRTLHRMREDIRKTILSAVHGGGWLVTQPNPTKIVTEEIDQIDIEPENAGNSAAPELAFFAPDVQPIARWLLETGRLPRERLTAIREDTKDPGMHVLRVAYDALPEGARESARRLQVVRAPSKRNGTLGPFRWAVNPDRLLEIAPKDVDVLAAAGVLLCDDERYPCQWVMSRRAREIFAMHAAANDGETVRDLHDELAVDVSFANRSVEEKIEVHHHAARACNLSRASETAEFFGLELRALASQISRERGDFEGAAKLFRHLVENFDASDAYAWEYLGYNLARADTNARRRGLHSDEILAAYRKAHELDKKNPLYHGRLLGYRAELGHSVLNEINAAMGSYAERGDAGDFVSWFVMPILDGLYRSKRHIERTQIVDTWGTLLEWCAPGVLEKHGMTEE